MGRGKAQQSLDLIQAAHDILARIQPASVRAVCYQLFIAGVIPSMAKKETNRVSTQLRYAREESIIPWEWIVDETRDLERASSWAGPEQYIEVVQRSYRRDRWAQQPERVEVWSEKGTIRGTLGPVLDTYCVGFRVMHGYSSATTVHDVAEFSAADPRPLTVFYLGDWDPSGLHMSEVDLPRRLEEYGADMDLALQRVALLPEDIADPNLPSFSAFDKTKDPRWAWFIDTYGRHCWELDALSPVVLRERVEQAIVNMIEPDAWERCAKVEAAERAAFNTILGNWKGAIA